MDNLKITSKDSIQQLLCRKGKRRLSKIEIDIERLDEAKVEYFERKLNRYFFSCGCETGAVSCFISIVAYILGFRYFKGTGIFSWQFVKYGLLALFISALLGKIGGLVYAKYKLRATVRKLKRELELIFAS